jgi:hypothetical protein
MITLINKTEEIMKRLEKEEKRNSSNKPDYFDKVNEIYEFMQEVNRNYNYKSAMSSMEAEKVWLD